MGRRKMELTGKAYYIRIYNMYNTTSYLELISAYSQYRVDNSMVQLQTIHYHILSPVDETEKITLKSSSILHYKPVATAEYMTFGDNIWTLILCSVQPIPKFTLRYRYLMCSCVTCGTRYSDFECGRSSVQVRYPYLGCGTCDTRFSYTVLHCTLCCTYI